MQRYFIQKSQIDGQHISITGDDVHHIKHVMRMKVGDKVIACDEENNYHCQIISISTIIELEILSIDQEQKELPIQVTIAHGLVRRDKTEEVIRRLVEIGCYQYLPVIMDHCVAKATFDKQERYEKIVKEASEQSGRSRLMKVLTPISFSSLMDEIKSYDLVLFAHVFYANDSQSELKKVLRTFHGKNILCIIGPEGGFSSREVEKIIQTKAITIGLGKRTLRTETAPLYIMSVISYEMENQNEN